MDKDVVVNGATIECTGSKQKSFLVVPPSFMIEVGGQHSANIKQHKPIENILPFGICEIQPGKPPCIPVTPTPWKPGETTVDFGREPTLEVKSKCKCDHGGIIEFVNSGQGNAFLSVDCQTPYSPLAEQAAWKFNQLKFVDALKAQHAAEEAAEAGERKLRNQLAKTALETAKEASGYNDAGKAIDAAKRGDLKGALFHGALAVPFSKPVKGAKAVADLPKALKGVEKEAAGRIGVRGAAGSGPRRVVEVVTEVPVSGATRRAHRRNANHDFAETLRSDPAFRRRANEVFGQDILEHMESGRGALKNPPGTEWHHPIDRSDRLQLLRKEVHRDPALQHILHDERGRGGWFHKHQLDK